MNTPAPKDIDLLISLYLDGDIETQDFQSLEAWLKEDREHVAYLVDRVADHCRTAELVSGEFNLPFLAPESESIFQDALEPELPLIHIDSSSPLTNKAFSSALTYVIEHTFTPKRITATVAAAIILLGLVLTIVLLTSGDDTPEIVTLPDFTPVTPTPDPNRVVATVTDQVNAQWVNANGGGALPDRMLLAVNQRLTLTKGFAEITTNRGAKVLIQAPATIETTESDNAIRLHRGKLVGICETPRSKGFVVHAPGMDVVDLGTRFGVSTQRDGVSMVRVIQGEVRAQPAPQSPQAFDPVVLLKDEDRRVVPETGALEVIAAGETPVFYEEVPHPYVQAVLDAKPLAYWRFEEDSDQAIVNSVKPGRADLEAIGQAFVDPNGAIGRSGRLTGDADSSFLMEGQLDELSQTDVFTIALWFRPDVHHLEQSTLFSLYDLEGADSTLRHIAAIELGPTHEDNSDPIGDGGKQSVRGLFCDPPNPVGSFGNNLFSDKHPKLGDWQYVALVKHADKLELYLDGRLVRSSTASVNVASGGRVSIGLHQKSTPDRIEDPEERDIQNRPMIGWVDEVAIFDKSLTADQISNHYSLIAEVEKTPR